MFTSTGEGSCDNFSGLLVGNQLRLLGVAPLFAAVVPILAFFGRSIGCSLASTNTTSKTVSLGWSAFLPGKRNFPERTSVSSTFANGTTDGRFADTVGLCNMKFGSIFAPVHQGHQELIGSTQLWWSSKLPKLFLNNFEHPLKVSRWTPVSRLKSVSFSCSIVSYRMCQLWHTYARGLLSFY